MDVHAPLALLGGLSPAAFMRRHWQKAPLLVRDALPPMKPLLKPPLMPPLSRAALFALAARDDVEARLVIREGRQWSVKHGPLMRRALPPINQPGWTLLVQGVDLHVAAARMLLNAFRFVPEVRLDDLMISWASDGGGVGAHVDSYDVFLLQVQGRRRWRVGPAPDRSCRPGLPLKVLRRFTPTESWVLGPGDMLYLPPGWGHDGVAVGGDCMTASIGFRAPSQSGLAAELAQRLADALAQDAEHEPERLYVDAAQRATAAPGAIPPRLATFAQQALMQLLREPGAIERALGEVLSEPKPRVWFAAGAPWQAGSAIALAAATRLVYDERHVFINGESFRATGTDQRLLCALADCRELGAKEAARFSVGARALISAWHEQGWLVPCEPADDPMEDSR